MLTVANIDAIKVVIAVLLVYFPTVTISGYFAAWFAKKMGDDTAEQAGLLTLNPAAHVRPSGLLILLFSVLVQFPFVIGFGTYVPVNEHRIDHNWRKLKYLLALWSRGFMNAILFCLTTVLFVLLWRFIIVPGNLLTTCPTLVQAFALIAMMAKYLNLISALLEFIFDLVIFVLSILFPRMEHENMMLILATQISLLILAWHFLEPYINLIIVLCDNWVVSLLGSLI